VDFEIYAALALDISAPYYITTFQQQKSDCKVCIGAIDINGSLSDAKAQIAMAKSRYAPRSKGASSRTVPTSARLGVSIGIAIEDQEQATTDF
jgi:hypothetical protein